MKFDIILSNPPFNLGVKFFQKYFEFADKIITIQPTKWLLTNKQNKNLTNKIDKQYCEIETVNGNEYFDAGLFADVSINYVDNKKSHKLIFDNKEYNKFTCCKDVLIVLSIEEYVLTEAFIGTLPKRILTSILLYEL